MTEPTVPSRCRWRCSLAIIVWLGVVGLCIWGVDRPVAAWVHEHPLSPVAKRVLGIVRLPGNYIFTLAVAGLAVAFYRRCWRMAVLMLSGGALAGAIVHVLKWTVGRHRPKTGVEGVWRIHPFPDGLHGFFVRQGELAGNLSFPSGDSCLAFATAAAASHFFPRWRYVFYLWAAGVALQRVLSESHYTSEVIAGAGVGILSTLLVRTLYPRCAAPFGEVRAVADRPVAALEKP